MQPVGANLDRFFELITTYPNSKFSTLVDNSETIRSIAAKALAANIKVSLWLDLNIGMNRTGIVPDQIAAELFSMMANDPNLIPMGLHAYDGHIRESNPEKRKELCDAAFDSVLALKKVIEQKGISVSGIVAGGSPTFPFHAKRKGVDASPGTTLLWEAGYEKSFPDIKMLPAAVLFTRVISKPKMDLLCLDLGHKSVASEMPLPRVVILGLENSTQIGQSEEHLVAETPHANHYPVGHEFYAIPIHICPTVAKYKAVVTVIEGKATGYWKVTARDHQIEI